MRHLYIFASLFALSAQPAAAAFTLGDFEMPLAGMSGTGFSYLAGPHADWTWLNGGVINGATGTPWFGGTPPGGYAGDQYAFLQSGGALLTREVTLAQAGLVTLTWLATGRPDINFAVSGDTNYTVSFGGLSLHDSTSSGAAFAAHVLTGTLAAGTHTLSFLNTSVPGDRSLFLDAVTLTAEPVAEPASAALLLAGLTAFGWRRRRA